MSIRSYIKVLLFTIAVSILAACGGTSVDSSSRPPVGTPEADAGPDINITEGLQVSLVGAGYDTDGTIASYAWEQTAGTEVTLTGAETATLSFIAPDVNETLTFVLTVTDNDGNSWSDAVNVLVERLPNNPPSANAGSNQTVFVDTEVTLRGSGSDIDGEVELFVWQQTAGETVSLADNTTATTTFTTPSTAGTLTFNFTVFDNEGASTTDSVDIDVGLLPNNPPQVEAGLPQNVFANELVTLSGSASDDDGEVVSYLWEQIAGIQIELSDNQILTPTFTSPSTPTEMQFRLTVTDDDGDTQSDTVTVFVDIIVNQFPVANAGSDQTVFVDELVALSGSGSDEDGTVVSYFWQQTAGATASLNDVNSNSPVFTAPSSADILSFRLTVSDNDGDTHSDSVNIGGQRVRRGQDDDRHGHQQREPRERDQGEPRHEESRDQRHRHERPGEHTACTRAGASDRGRRLDPVPAHRRGHRPLDGGRDETPDDEPGHGDHDRDPEHRPRERRVEAVEVRIVGRRA